MFRIRQIHSTHAPLDQRALASVLRIYEKAFPYAPHYSEKIAGLLKFSSKVDFDVVLLVAEGDKDRILGFSLSFYLPRLKFAYLDYIATDPKRLTRGYGVALYERNRELLKEMGCKVLFMDVPPDDVDKLKEPLRLRTNQRRMAFYERMGAFPIVGTKYDSVTHKANQGYFTYLVFENFDASKVLTAAALRKCVARILEIKGNMPATDRNVRTILDSIKDGPVRLREPRYRSREALSLRKTTALRPLDLIVTDDRHQIHHLAEKGYVERPARVQFILRGLESFKLNRYKVRHFGEKYITDVHHPSLFEFLKKAEKELTPGELVYPNVFPIRRPDRIPKTWEMKAGYYCIDTFTPVTANAYKAARHAVDAALTGAERVLRGSRHAYVLCRPPGHHAESRVFGGFCYFNNAAIAAQYLSRHGRVAFIDIDHHHGNGSQEIFYKRNDVYFVSIHGHPRTAYPYFAGYSDERGDGPGKGFNRNFPLYPGSDDDTYLKTLAEALNILRRFRPDFLVVSLGLDIMAGDPTGAFLVSVRGMQRIGALFGGFSVPMLIVQEGGYTLRNLRTGASAFFTGLLG